MQDRALVSCLESDFRVDAVPWARVTEAPWRRLAAERAIAALGTVRQRYH